MIVPATLPLVLQWVFAIIFVARRRPRRGLLLWATSAVTLVVLVLWTGHDLASGRDSELLRWS